MSEGTDFDRALVAHLKDDATLAALVAGRIYSAVPAHRAFPYVAFGETFDDAVAEGEGLDAVRHDFILECWSASNTIAEAAEIAEALWQALHDAALYVGETAVGDLQHVRTSLTRDPVLRGQGLEFITVQFSAYVEDGARRPPDRPSAMFTNLGLYGVTIRKRGTFQPKEAA